MIRLYYGQPNDFDRGWTIESLWKPHTKNGLKMPSFGRHFCWEKMAAGVFTTGHLELKYFEINEIISA